jgi:hypothetical protein
VRDHDVQVVASHGAAGLVESAAGALVPTTIVTLAKLARPGPP